MVDWALFERWTELRGKLKVLSRQRAEAAETSRLLAEASVSLELELSKLEVERSKELAALFCGLGEAYAAAPMWQDDEHTRVGLGPQNRREDEDDRTSPDVFGDER